MSIQFPREFTPMWKAAGVKAAFVTEAHPNKPSDCVNCGGIGTMTTFCATAGPFNVPPAPNHVGHFANGKWWSGQNYSFNCPVCNGSGLNPQVAAPEIRQGVIHWQTITPACLDPL